MWAQLAGAALGAVAGADSASKASYAQRLAADQALAFQREVFAKQQELQKPFLEGGYTAQDEYLKQLGLVKGKDGKYVQAVDENGQPIDPYEQYAQSDNYKQLQSYSDRQDLAQAGVTGGLRGGNVQQLLATSAPSLLSQLYQQRLQNLAPLIGIGQNAASNTGNAASDFANNSSKIGIDNAKTQGKYSLFQGGQYNSLLAGLGANKEISEKINSWISPTNPIGGKTGYNPAVDAYDSSSAYKSTAPYTGQYGPYFADY